MAVIKYTVSVDHINESEYWYKDDKLHREGDLPAVIRNGAKLWYKDGVCHREGGPAIIYADGSQLWYKNGKLHREDGPAYVYGNDEKCWFLDGDEYTEKQFNEKMNPVESCHNKMVEIDGKKYKLMEIQ